MYTVRNAATLTPLAALVAQEGIAHTQEVYSVNELAEINAAMDPLFASRSNEKRSYVRGDEMQDLGALDLVLNRRMLDVLTSVMPDPVLYHFHAYEIVGNSDRSHIFSESLAGWHRDPDSEYYDGDPTHVSVFVYLSDVGEDDGAFELSPAKPTQGLKPDSNVASITGATGSSFVWHRGFYHRASPNRGPRRRRLIKISVQRNCFHSAHLGSDFFTRMVSRVRSGDELMDSLVGRYQGKEAPKFLPSQSVRPQRHTVFRSIELSEGALDRLKAKEKDDATKPVAYD